MNGSGERNNNFLLDGTDNNDTDIPDSFTTVVVGIVIGATVHSQPLAIAMGAIGAGRSIYNNFVARGTDVVFAKHTAMEIGVDTRGAAPGQTASPVSNNSPH